MTDHLHSEAKKLLDHDIKDQVHWLKTRKWFPYSTGQRALDTIDGMLNHPPTHRMPSMLLIGQTNNGKTMILEEALNRHPPRSVPTEDSDQVPIIFLTMPPGPELRRFYTLILAKIGAVHRPSDSTSRLESQVLTLLKAVGTRIVIIDELHNIADGKYHLQRQFLNMLRFLSNELRISFICAGTKKAVRTIQSDDQLANRFQPMILPEWRDGQDYRKFLYFLESTLPLTQPSLLYKSDIAPIILTIAERTVGEMISFVNEATFVALANGATKLTREHFDEAAYVSPSKRRAEAEKLAI